MVLLILLSGITSVKANIFDKLRYHKTESYIFFENKCNYPVNFMVRENKYSKDYEKIFLEAGQRSNANYYQFKKKQFSFAYNGKQQGSLNLNLYKGALTSREHVKNISGNISIDADKPTWSSRYGIHSFTITACPTVIDTKNSPILTGVKRILLFGDSLTDQGRLYKSMHGKFPVSPPYYNGRFSNGNPWSVLLTNELRGKINIKNYAVGGATAIFHRGDEYLPFDLFNEYINFDIHSKIAGWQNKDRDLVFILIGANDYEPVSKESTEKDMEELTTKVVNNIAWVTNRLIKKGVKKFVFMGLPNLGITPESRNIYFNQKVTSRLSLLHNEKLKALTDNYIKTKTAKSGYFFKFIDLNTVMNELIYHTKAFNQKYGLNITNTTDPCWTGGYTSHSSALYRNYSNVEALYAAGILCKDPEHHAFWDHIHPTSQIHATIYKIIKQELGMKTVPLKAN